MTDNEIKKALDILAKLDFFGGQRAGRELWNEKPVDVQNEDIENFSKDVAFLKDFINRLQAENEELVGNIDRLKAELFDKTEQLEIAKAEAYKEFFQLLHKKLTNTSNSFFECKNLKACEVLQDVIGKLRETYKEKVGECNA